MKGPWRLEKIEMHLRVIQRVENKDQLMINVKIGPNKKIDGKSDVNWRNWNAETNEENKMRRQEDTRE